MNLSESEIHRPFVGSVFKSLRAQRGLALVILAVGLILAFAVSLIVHPKYAASATLLLVDSPEVPTASALVTTSTAPILPVDLPALASSNGVIAKMRHAFSDKHTDAELRRSIKARITTSSNLMTIQVSAISPAEAVSMVNTAATAIKEEYQSVATSRADSVIHDLNDQVRLKANVLAQLDRELESLAGEYPYVDVGTSAGSVYDRMIALRASREDALASIASDRVGTASAKRLLANVIAPAMRDITEADPSFRAIRDQYIKDESALERVKSFAGASYPGLPELRDIVARDAKAVASARSRAISHGLDSNTAYAGALDEEVRADRQLIGDEARVASIDAELHQLSIQMQANGVATRIARIRRDRQNVEVVYAALSERLAKAQADRAEAATTGSLTVLDYASDAQRSLLSSPGLVFALLALIAVWVAATVAVIVDGSQRRFGTLETIESVYGVPVIGSIV